MAVTLEKAPLIELVADLKWTPALANAQDQSGAVVMIPQSLLDPSQSELFFTRFGGAIYQHGFKVQERLFPQGMLPPDQMVYRYRQVDTNAPPVLLQVGTNQFSANALTPYKTWAEFRPWVEKGVAALIEVKPAELATLRASLRYIDGFRNDITEGVGPTEFLSSLGIKVDLPAAFTKRVKQDAKVKSAVQLNIPLDGMQMQVKAGEGIVQGETIVLLDTHVSVTADIVPTVKAVMDAFEKAHATIHDTFFELVKPILPRLKPKEQE